MADSNYARSYKEVRYFKFMFAMSIVLLLLGIATFGYSIYYILSTQKYAAFFELFYMAALLIGMILFVSFSFQAIKKRKSQFMINLMFNERGRSTPALVITMTLAVIGWGLAIYFGLMFFGVAPLIFNFNDVLILAIFDTGLFLGILCLFFFFYPITIHKQTYKL